MIKNYIFLGAPGVGKGPIASRLEKETGIVHISTGELFREAIKNKTPLGIQVKSIIDAGNYVPDEVTNALVKEILLTDKIQKNGFMLDGYPRTINQAEFLKNNNFNVTATILLDASDDIVINRLVNRKRADDNLDIIKHRIEVYNKQTKPLIDYYKKEKLLVTIDASGSIEENMVNLHRGLDD